MTVPLYEEERERRIRPDGVTHVRRRAFARDFPYQRGDHVVFGGPSTRGKTTLCFDLLEYVCSPTCPAYVAQSKPRDPVTESRSMELGFREVSEWPPQPKLGEMKMFGGQKPSGYLIKPPFGNLETDMEACAELTHELLMERYAAGASRKFTGGILVMDDTMVKAKVMHLDGQMVTILAMAGAMNLGMWSFNQRPTDSGRTSLWAFEQAKHFFFTKGGDARMLKRYSELFGENSNVALSVIPTLNDFEFLYYHRDRGYLCVVGAN